MSSYHEQAFGIWSSSLLSYSSEFWVDSVGQYYSSIEDNTVEHVQQVFALSTCTCWSNRDEVYASVTMKQNSATFQANSCFLLQDDINKEIEFPLFGFINLKTCHICWICQIFLILLQSQRFHNQLLKVATIMRAMTACLSLISVCLKLTIFSFSTSEFHQ